MADRHSNDAALIPAVAYYRMSSRKQDKSIASQRGEVEWYAQEHGYRIIRPDIYVDEAISGAESDKRPGFKRLILDAQEKGGFDVILCWDQDRFSRFDPLEANYYWFLLRQAGVRIVTVTQGEMDLADLGGWLTASVMQHGKAQYLRDLSRNSLRGRLTRAKQGKWVGSRPAYGYRPSGDGQIALGPDEEVQAIQWLFTQYTETDTTLADLAAQLNQRDLPSPSGTRWNKHGVHHILRREAYLGQVVQFRTHKGTFHTIRNQEIVTADSTREKRIPDPTEELLKVQCPQIIAADVWQHAQEKLSKRAKGSATRRRGGQALLTGLVYCGHCGQRMFSSDRPLPKGRRKMTYVCSSYNAHGTHVCYRNSIDERPILDFLVGKIRDVVLSPDNLGRLKAELDRQATKQRRTTPAAAERLRSRMSKLDEDVKAAARELKRTPDDLYDLAVEDVRELREKRKCLASQLEDDESVRSAQGGSAASIADQAFKGLGALKDRIDDADPRIAREALHRVVDRIDLHFDHVHHEKFTRSFFKKGLVNFEVTNPLRQTISRQCTKRPTRPDCPRGCPIRPPTGGVRCSRSTT